MTRARGWSLQAVLLLVLVTKKRLEREKGAMQQPSGRFGTLTALRAEEASRLRRPRCSNCCCCCCLQACGATRAWVSVLAPCARIEGISRSPA